MVAAFLFTQLSFVAFGLAVAFHPRFRSMGWPARLGAAFLAGALLLSVEMTLLSLVGVVWSLWTVALPLLALSLWMAVRWRRDGHESERSRVAGQERRSDPLGGIGWALIAPALALIHLFGALISGRATSTDYIFFWGVKALRYAALGGIENELLRWKYAIHIHTNYPPLFVNTLAWGATLLGELPWLGAVLTCLLWLLAAWPLVFSFLRTRAGGDAAAVAASFWTTALAISLASSACGGNAEAPLLAYQAVALAALLMESRSDSREARMVAAVCLAGAVATKLEGFFAWGLILVAAMVRDLLWRKPSVLRRALPLILIPGIVAGIWFAYQLIHDLPLGDPTRTPGWDIHFTHLGPTLLAMTRSLHVGSFGLAWIVPLIFVMLWQGQGTRQWLIEVLPALAVTVGLFFIFLAYYLHERGNPTELIGWTFPRVIQPALSAWILACAFRARSSHNELADG